MADFPTSAEEFYRLRDDRTDKCGVNRRYQQTHCVVLIGPETSSTLIGQTMLLVTANLLSRWCRHVTIVMPSTRPHQDLNMIGGDLREIILEQMHDADPFGVFEIKTAAVDTGDIALHIGSDSGNGTAVSRVFINASGWYAGISRSGAISIPPDANPNGLGAVTAACFGVAQVFKMAIGLSEDSLIQDGVFDLFRLEWNDGATYAEQPYPQDANFGRALMVGAGSVGSAVAYCLRLVGIAGNLTIVDEDVVKVENFNRSPIFGRAAFGLNKAEAVARYLSNSSVVTTPVPHWWQTYAKQDGASLAFDVWFPLANEFGVRWSMQNNVPPLMIHASTTANWGANHGRHIPGRDDCLADRFPDGVGDNQLTCATGSVETPESPADAALPFLSLFAGLLVVSDLVRAQLPGYPQVPNFALFDFSTPLDNIQRWDRQPNPQCICEGQHRMLHERFNGTTKYWPVFGFDSDGG